MHQRNSNKETKSIVGTTAPFPVVLFGICINIAIFTLGLSLTGLTQTAIDSSWLHLTAGLLFHMPPPYSRLHYQTIYDFTLLNL